MVKLIEIKLNLQKIKQTKNKEKLLGKFFLYSFIM